MAHPALVSRFLLFCICSLLIAGCSSPNRKVENAPVSAVVAPDAHERAAAYAERLRLGLGSPYRLIEIAARDQRLGAASAPVARALFAQIERGELYQVGPHALMAAGVRQSNAIAQLELIEQAIAGADDPLIGELAVNLAYELAVAQRVVTPTAAARAVRIAAVTRDRALAIADAKRLRAAARRAHVDPENLVAAWRAQRFLTVERPTLMPLNAAAQDEAARRALLLIGGIRSAATPFASVMQRTVIAHPGFLSNAAARVLVHDSAAVSQSALVVTMRQLRAAHAGHNWREFFNSATNEERFVAALAIARADSIDDVVAAAVALDAAIALRPFAQERALPDTLSQQELAKRFGVKIRFDKNVSAEQRTRTLQILTNALADLRSVIRTLDLNGLTFEIAPIAAGAPHLAFHDPRARVIRLDPATMAGTLAHELAHDLDWQLAARKYRTRANYATDYATRNRRALAYAVESLSGATAEMAQTPADNGARRPAEIFARRFEWYVASALALRGRSSGYLSSAQTDWIPGYGSAVRPDAAAAAAQSFAALVAEATNMDRSELADVERIVVESSPVVTRVVRSMTERPNPQTRQHALDALRNWECSSAWHITQTTHTGLYAFVDVLTSAAYAPAAAAEPLSEVITLRPVRAVDSNRLGFSVGSCNRLDAQ